MILFMTLYAPVRCLY